jgi:hypothetical protein
MRCYVLEIVEGCNIVAHQTTGEGDQTHLAKKLAKENGRAAVLAGEVQFFWADVDKDGRLEVGAFDEELEEED